jgi:hypothetical protein
MKWSTVLVTGSIGTRAAGDQFTPSVDVERMMSFELQFLRKRQSHQATYTLPLASTAADGHT